MTPIEFMRVYEKAPAAHDLLATADLIDESAVCFFSNASSHLGKPQVGGVAMSGGGRGTSALRREGASWRVVHEHLSSGPYKS